jgi:hypothetical protein
MAREKAKAEREERELVEATRKAREAAKRQLEIKQVKLVKDFKELSVWVGKAVLATVIVIALAVLLQYAQAAVSSVGVGPNRHRAPDLVWCNREKEWRHNNCGYYKK